ncbi:uncharacterized protein LOC133327328 [Musca vetustissima]|uniref:uncharacterized protein LOC133327328 n=1 Tax=Musca vetustissima TaxID=27455 RepID=UPI002AB74316|nr:uncharacterized protein LOC133327328 [Musca vetustissima]
MSLSYTFNVVELKANIIGPTDLYVKSGSDINLTCKIMQGPHELGNIFWYKGLEIIDMSTNQNEIDSGNRITMENDWSDGLTSRLKIRRAMPSDTGNYTCVPTIAKSSSVYVHVIIGEHPAAMQHNSSKMHSSNFYFSICCMLFTILTCCLQHLMSTTIAATATTTITRTLVLPPSTSASALSAAKQHKTRQPAVTKVISTKQVLSSAAVASASSPRPPPGPISRTSTLTDSKKQNKSTAVSNVVVATVTSTACNIAAISNKATATTNISRLMSCRSSILR